MSEIDEIEKFDRETIIREMDEPIEVDEIVKLKDQINKLQEKLYSPLAKELEKGASDSEIREHNINRIKINQRILEKEKEIEFIKEETDRIVTKYFENMDKLAKRVDVINNLLSDSSMFMPIEISENVVKYAKYYASLIKIDDKIKNSFDITEDITPFIFGLLKFHYANWTFNAYTKFLYSHKMENFKIQTLGSIISAWIHLMELTESDYFFENMPPVTKEFGNQDRLRLQFSRTETKNKIDIKKAIEDLKTKDVKNIKVIKTLEELFGDNTINYSHYVKIMNDIYIMLEIYLIVYDFQKLIDAFSNEVDNVKNGTQPEDVKKQVIYKFKEIIRNFRKLQFEKTTMNELMKFLISKLPLFSLIKKANTPSELHVNVLERFDDSKPPIGTTIATATPVENSQLTIGGFINYKQKYLKYKNKYLRLKKLNY